MGSSPHTRGAPHAAAIEATRPWIIPAYAGSTSSSTSRPPPQSDHPRIRGEHVVPLVCDTTRLGSSPHTRGARRAARRWFWRRGIIPAYAGSTLGNPCNTKDHRRDYTSFPLPVTHPSGGGGS